MRATLIFYSNTKYEANISFWLHYNDQNIHDVRLFDKERPTKGCSGRRQGENSTKQWLICANRQLSWMSWNATIHRAKLEPGRKWLPKLCVTCPKQGSLWAPGPHFEHVKGTTIGWSCMPRCSAGHLKAPRAWNLPNIKEARTPLETKTSQRERGPRGL